MQYFCSRDAIKDHDMFGHTIQLNFDKQGESHNTLLGGIFSIFIKIIMSVYIGLCFKKLLYMEDDSISLFLEQQDLKVTGDVNYAEGNLLIFQDIRKSKGSLRSLEINEESERFITFSYVYMTVDWYLPPETRYTYSEANMKQCTQEDFCFNEECSEGQIESFRTW